MSRPFALCGFTFLLALILSSFIGSTLSLVLTGVLIFCCLLALLLKNKDDKNFLITVLLSVAVGLIVFTANYEIKIAPTERLIGQTGNVHGVIIDTPEKKNSNYQYKILSDTVDVENAPQKTKIIVSLPNDIGAVVNDEISVSVKFMDNSKYAEYANGFYLRGTAVNDASLVKKDHKTFYGEVGKLRARVKSNIKELLPNEEGDIIVAMILGDKSGLDETLKNAFSESGVYHIFAVSGLHISLWSILVFAVLRKLKIPIPISCIVSCGFVIFYMALTGFTMSVLRAGIMMILTLCGKAFFRRTDTLNSLGFAVLTIGLFTPMSALSVSFLLTVFATTGVITLGAKISNQFSHAFDNLKLKVIGKSVVSCLAISMSVIVFTLPICAIFFKKIALISMLANVIIIPIGTATIVLGGLLGALAPLAVLKYPLALLAGLGAKAMIWLSKTFANVPFGSVGLEEDYWLLSIAGILLVSSVAILIGKKKFPIKAFAISCALLLIVPSAVNGYLNKDVLKLRLLDTFDGMTIVATFQGKSAVISSGGYRLSSNIAEVLSKNNVNGVDLLIIPAIDENVAEQLLPLAEMCQVSQVVIPTENQSVINTFDKVSVSQNITLALWDCISVKYEYRDKTFWVGIEYKNSTVICVSGNDVNENQLDEKYRTPDVVITQNEPSTTLHGNWNISTGNVPSRQNQKIGKLVSTQGLGDVILRIDDKKRIDARREKQWER